MQNTCFNSIVPQFPYVIHIFVTTLCNHSKDAHQPLLAQTLFSPFSASQELAGAFFSKACYTNNSHYAPALNQSFLTPNSFVVDQTRSKLSFKTVFSNSQNSAKTTQVFLKQMKAQSA